MNTNLDLNVKSVIKFTIISLISSLILGIIFYNLTQFTVYQYEFYVSTGLTVLAFPLGAMISTIISSAYMDNKVEAVIMALIVAILTAFLQSKIISLLMGELNGKWFLEYIGNQVFLLIIFAVIAAYIGNIYLKEKIMKFV